MRCLTLAISLLLVGHVFANADVVVYQSSVGNPNSFPASSISTTQFLGSRFSLDATTQVSGIGGTFATGVGGTIFAAVVELSGQTPMGSPFETNELLLTTVFEPSGIGDDIVPVSLNLSAGDYALIFGTGLFGATGVNAMSGDGTVTQQGQLSFFSWNGANWLPNSQGDGRFVVLAIPEPTATGLLTVFGAFCLSVRSSRGRS